MQGRNKRNKLFVLVSLVCCFFVAACAMEGFNASSIADCKVGRICRITGELTAYDGVGKLEDSHDCVAVSLDPTTASPELTGTFTLTGKVHIALNTFGWFKYEIDGRWFDAEVCDGELAMYVDRVERGT